MYLSSSAFQLLLNCRIVMVAISTILVLGKPINAVEWVAVILLTTGAVQYNLSGCEPGSLRINVVGVAVMVLIASCAAGGNVYTQLVMQKKMDQPLMFQNAQLYAYGVLFNGVNWLLSMGVTAESEAFGEIGYKPVLAMLFYALYGLCISVILKRFGAMVRTFINALAIVFNGMLDATFFGATITLSDLTCFSVILCATVLYGNLAKDYRPVEGARQLPMSDLVRFAPAARLRVAESRGAVLGAAAGGGRWWRRRRRRRWWQRHQQDREDRRRLAGLFLVHTAANISPALIFLPKRGFIRPRWRWRAATPAARRPRRS